MGGVRGGGARPPGEGPTLLTQTAVGSDYMLRSSDLVSVTVFQEPDLAVQDRVAADGTINVPLIGRVPVVGRTATAAADIVRQRLDAEYIVHPQVSVTVVEYTKQFFTLLGQVTSPGAYALPPNGHLPLMQAIGQAGGFTRIANASKITVKRTANGRETILKVDGKRLASSESQPFDVLPGDVITIGESMF